MRPRPSYLNPWRILVPIVFLTVMTAIPALAGRNAGGALIVHTNDAVAYTVTGDYCQTSFLPASCEAAVTRTDKDEDTPAVIWLLAAFPDTSSPAVTAIQFGIEHNLPANEGYFEHYAKCGDLEMPDQGWPETGFGNLLSFGSAAKTELLFPFYWFAAYGFEGAYLGTRTYPSTDEAKFVGNENPPLEDRIFQFGIVRWYAQGANSCPAFGSADQNEDHSGGVDDNETTDASTQVLPEVIYTTSGTWSFLVYGPHPNMIASVGFQSNDERVDANLVMSTGPVSSLWTVAYPELTAGAPASVTVRLTTGATSDFPITIAAPDPIRGELLAGSVTVDLRPGTIVWAPVTGLTRESQIRTPSEVAVSDTLLHRSISGLGVTGIRKLMGDIADGDSTWSMTSGGTAHIPVAARSTYTLFFPKQVSSWAVAEILRMCPSVLDVAPAGRINPESTPECPASDPFWSSEWYMKSSQETDSCCVLAANHAWCISRGAGIRIYVVDCMVNPDHPDLTVQLRPGIWFPEFISGWSGINHGSFVGVMAAGHHTGNNSSAGQEYAGVAPEDIIHSSPFYYSDPLDYAIDAIRYVGDVATGALSVMTCAWSVGYYTQGQYQTMLSLAQLCKTRNVLFLAATPRNGDTNAIPAAMESVYGVCGIRSDGSILGIADSLAAIAPVVWSPPSFFGVDGTVIIPPSTSMATALAAGAASVVAGCAGLNVADPNAAAWLGHLMVEDCHPTGGGIRGLDAERICALVPIQDVTNVSATGGNHNVTISWTLTDAENVDGFAIWEAASCWGPFEATTTWIPCTGAGNYAETVSAPYAREYYYKLVAWGGGASMEYKCHASPSVGDGVDPLAAPVGVTFSGRPPTGSKIQWQKRNSLSYHIYYEVYRGCTTPLDECGYDEHWGNWRIGEVDNNVQSCADPPEMELACWWDENLVPGRLYAYRVATLGKDNQGRTVFMSAPSSEVVGYSQLPGEVDALVGTGEDLSFEIANMPIHHGNCVRLEILSGRAREVSAGLYDSAGRVISLKATRWLVSEGRTSVVATLAGGESLARGVYFIRIKTGDGFTAKKKLIVLD